ncbi:MAG TPA: M48 family metalloprotease [Burkholderiales bacterium]|nr:M48 family metalloprotease [Burkholderiales bacterium]
MKFRSVIAVVMLAPALGLGDELPDLGDVSQGALSPVQERKLGEGIMSQIRANSAYIDDPDIADYLNGVGYQMVSNSPDPAGPFEFFGIADNSVNAFALPGGFIGVHSGLLLSAQSESELASVLSHEIAHVTQRHLARMVAAQQRAGLASMAALAVAILAARSNPEVSAAAITAAQAGTIQSALNFTREHEREADRIGLQIMEKSNFDVHAMPVFFERLQKATRVYETGAPAYLRTHPLTFERIADVQSRIQDVPFRQVPDSLEFLLVRARLSALEGNARTAVANFDELLSSRKFASEAAARYGLVVALLRAGDFPRARKEVAVLQSLKAKSPMIDALTAQCLIANGELEKGLATYRDGLRANPSRRTLVYGYASALLDATRAAEAVNFLTVKLETRSPDARLYELQSRGYSALGMRMLQHRAQAEAYVLRGNLPAAIEQLQLAQRAGDGDFYQKSSVEARLKELVAIDTEGRRRRP